MSFQTVGFIGLGLIGGSIARAVRQTCPDTQILGFDTDRDNVTQALSEGVLTSALSQADASFSACDLIFLCAPVTFNNDYLAVLKKLLKPGALLTDVGSVKSGIHRTAASLGLNDCFIGGHPMAGSEKSGFLNSNSRLIENAYYILTPAPGVPKAQTGRFKNFIRSLGALPLLLTWEEHDRITAAVSHLPHLLASGLVNVVKEADTDDGKMRLLAAGGFKDITRIASSSPVMWQQICLLNRGPILEILDAYLSYLSGVRRLIEDVADGETTIRDSRCVDISYPGFFEDLHGLMR